MSSVWGRNLTITVFGQSHAEAIGVVVDGLPAGLRIDTEELQAFMKRRAAGGAFATARVEADTPEFVSGLVDGVTCGAPVTALIRNTNVRSGDYSDLRDHPRPSHADYPASVRFDGANDIRGGGQFSGRLTAALCVAGGLCMQFLKTKGIAVGAHIASIGNIQDGAFDPVNVTAADFVTDSFPVRDEQAKAAMQEIVTAARNDGDSVGGTIECAAVGVPTGIGDPLFDGLENRISSIVFGIPAVKGIEFGNGFDAAELKGSENNDAYYMEGDTVKTRTNRHGGILGGISTGMPLIFRVAIKPTPSIAKEQQTVELSSKTDYTLAIKGRHDPCIVPRAVPCVEAALAIALADYLV